MTNKEARIHHKDIDYQTILALEEFRKANEKQIPIKPIVPIVNPSYSLFDNSPMYIYHCSVCGRLITPETNLNFCDECGQHTDWSK